MRKIIRIPEYSVEIRYYNNLIECYDLVSETVIDSLKYKKNIRDVYKESFNCIIISDKYGTTKHYIDVDLVNEKYRIPTNAGYIFNLYSLVGNKPTSL